jgi:hypothetical protein
MLQGLAVRSLATLTKCANRLLPLCIYAGKEVSMATQKTAKKAVKRAMKGPVKKSVKMVARKAAKKSTPPPSKRWSAKVTTDSTKPGPGLFRKSGKAIAEGLANKSVSPKGPGQAMQMLSFYENRGGKNLPEERKRALESAKKILRKKEGKSAS